jgi:hypothetical protein
MFDSFLSVLTHDKLKARMASLLVLQCQYIFTVKFVISDTPSPFSGECFGLASSAQLVPRQLKEYEKRCFQCATQ